MHDSIISRETIRARARAAFSRGAGRNDHKMNPHAAAVDDWQAEWDVCQMEQLQAQRRATSGQLAEVSAP
jgi:hypothetical protein